MRQMTMLFLLLIGLLGTGQASAQNLFIADGTCPGPMVVQAVNMTEGANVWLIRAFDTGSYAIPSGPCTGTITGLDATATLLATAVSVGGTATFTGTAPPWACGAVYLQAVDSATCAATPVVLIP